MTRLDVITHRNGIRVCPTCGTKDPEYGTPGYNKDWKFDYEKTDYICEVGYTCKCGQKIVAYY